MLAILFRNWILKHCIKRKRKSVCCVHVLYKRLRLGVKTYEVFLCFLAIIFHAMALLCWLLSGFVVLIVLRYSRVSHQVFSPYSMSPTKREIRHFRSHRSRAVTKCTKKRDAQAELLFANLKAYRRRLCCSSWYQRRRRWRLQHWKRHSKKVNFALF